MEASPVAGHDSCRDARVQYASSSGSVSLSDASRAKIGRGNVAGVTVSALRVAPKTSVDGQLMRTMAAVTAAVSAVAVMAGVAREEAVMAEVARAAATTTRVVAATVWVRTAAMEGWRRARWGAGAPMEVRWRRRGGGGEGGGGRAVVRAVAEGALVRAAAGVAERWWQRRRQRRREAAAMAVGVKGGDEGGGSTGGGGDGGGGEGGGGDGGGGEGVGLVARWVGRRGWMGRQLRWCEWWPWRRRWQRRQSGW